MKNSLYSGVALAVLVALAGPAAAQQQNAQTSIELETINVEGQASGKTKGADHGDDEPTVATEAETVLTERVTRQRIDALQINEARDIGRLEPGVSFSESSQSFNIRGLDRARVLTTIDGIPVPWVDDVGGRSQATGVTAFGGVNTINFNSLSELDIVKGSDSSIYGNGGIGGVVAFRTLNPEDLVDAGENWGGLSKLSFDSKDKSWGADQAAAGRVENTWFMVQGGYRDGEEIENKGDLDIAGPTRTEKNPADYDQYNVLAKLRHYVDGSHMLGITAERFERNDFVKKYTASTTTTVPFSATSDEFAERERISAHYEYRPEEAGGGWLDAADAVAYWQRQLTEADYNSERRANPAMPPVPPATALTGPFQRVTTFEREIYGAAGNALKIVETGEVEHRIAFGGSVQGSKEHQYSAGEDQCNEIDPTPSSCSSLRTNMSDMPDVDGAAFGAYIQDEIALFGDTVRVTPGLRFDWYEYDPKLTAAFEANPIYEDQGLPDSNSDSAVSGKLRFEVDTIHEVTLFAQWAQGFRAPTADELFLTGGAPDAYLVVGNPNLKPETSNGFDLGALYGDNDLGGSVKAFYNRYKDFIDEVQLAPGCSGPGGNPATCNPEYPFGVTGTVNRANVEIYGAEFDAHYRHESGWHTWGRIGVYIGEDMDTGVGLNSVPAAKGIFGVGYATDSWGADLIYTAAAARDYKGSISPVAPSSGSDVEHPSSATPSYQLLDLTAWWSPDAVDGLTIRAGIYNIFDETYYEDALDITVSNKEYYTQPGRTFKASAVYKF